MVNIYKYRSPFRPMPMNYLPKETMWLWDFSDIGEWTPKTIYAFSQPIPEQLVKQWDLEVVNT